MTNPHWEITPASQEGEHAGPARRALMQPPASDLIRVGSRRWFLQTGNSLAQRSRIDPHVGTHPSMGAVAARLRGPNDPAMPAFVGMADQNLLFADVLGAGPLGAAASTSAPGGPICKADPRRSSPRAAGQSRN
jgi:hypothetical protein